MSAHLARDLQVAREALEGMREETQEGYLLDGVAAVCRGGVAALEERRGDALTDLRSAIHAFERSGNRFYVALTQLDALALMPDDPPSRNGPMRHVSVQDPQDATASRAPRRGRRGTGHRLVPPARFARRRYSRHSTCHYAVSSR